MNKLTEMKLNLTHKPKLGLALSGGGARGLAHIGVLKALEEAHISVDYLAGTSMGGVIAAAYAAGMSLEQIESIAHEYGDIRTLWRLADPTIPRRGLFKGGQLETFFKQHLGERTFADLHIPLTLVAVDLNGKQEVHLKRGPVAVAVRATVSVPGLLAPVERNGQRLVDGGLLNNLPVDVVRDMGADVVLAVDVYTGMEGPSFWQILGEKRFIAGTLGGMISTLGDSVDLLIYQQSAYRLRLSPPDFLLQPPIPPDVTVVSGYDKVASLTASGQETAQTILDDLQVALSPRWIWSRQHVKKSSR